MQKYLLLAIHYAISSVWLYLCYTVEMEKLPKGLFWAVIIIVLLTIQVALTGQSMESFEKSNRLVYFLAMLPIVMFFFGIVLFVFLNYKSTGGRWVFV